MPFVVTVVFVVSALLGAFVGGRVLGMVSRALLDDRVIPMLTGIGLAVMATVTIVLLAGMSVAVARALGEGILFVVVILGLVGMLDGLFHGRDY